MDITDSAAVEKVMTEVHPDKVVHCAAWTAVDAAEDNQEVCHKVNVDGTANIAKMCGKLDIPMVYISTDYVFDGQGTRPWEPDDPVVEPLNVYGQSKYEGEVAVEKYAPHYYIVRIAWVFGLNGKNFIKTMLNLGKTHDTLTVVDDQIGTPTYTYDLARLLVDMLEKEEYGKYHATNEGGYISWCDFAKEIFRQAGMDVKCPSGKFCRISCKGKTSVQQPYGERRNWKSMDLPVFRTGKMHLGRYLKGDYVKEKQLP